VAFTYDLTTTRGQVRLRAADTDASAYVFEDAEVDHAIAQTATVDAAAVYLLQILLVDGARRQKKFTIEGLSIDDGGRVEALEGAIRQLGGGMPSFAVRLPALLPSDRSFEEPV